MCSVSEGAETGEMRGAWELARDKTEEPRADEG